jgi:arginyl-tRNA synthetase
MPWAERVTVDGPGFINVSLTLTQLVSAADMLARDGLGNLLPDRSGGRRANVEYVSSNPTGPLTIGHCRQAVLGEAVSRMLEALGYEVHREYYFNDSGRQMELLGQSLAARYAEAAGISGPGLPESGYRGSYMAAWARELLEEEGSGLHWPEDSGRFTTFARERAMETIREDLALLGIGFDRYFRESELLQGAVEEAIGRLREADDDLVYSDRAGKLWLRLSALGRPEDRVIVRENGMCTYRMPDIAYHLDKFRRGFDPVVDVFGADHLDTSRDVTAALRVILGEEEVDRRLRIILHQFVTLVRGGRKVKMSTRAGDFVTLRDLVEEVGSPDVVRYLFLTRRAEAQMDFDLDLAVKESEENPVYYVQYAHARISGILEKASREGIVPPARDPGRIAALLDGEHERALLRHLESLPVRVEAAAEALEPHRITEMLAELATAFHAFYAHVRVVDAQRPDLSAARLLLCLACRSALRGMLAVLGVDAPDRM